jgi:hypothetical protein
MALKPNAQLVFTAYEVRYNGVLMHWVCYDPGPGEPSDYEVFVTDAEWVTITDLQSFNTLLSAKLKKLYRAEGISTRLDPLIGRTLTLP